MPATVVADISIDCPLFSAISTIIIMVHSVWLPVSIVPTIIIPYSSLYRVLCSVVPRYIDRLVVIT